MLTDDDIDDSGVKKGGTQNASSANINWFKWTCAALVLVLVVSCSAAFGASWNRYHAANVTIEDALRVLVTSQDEAEHEQALGVVGGRFEDLMRAIIAEEARRGATAPFATKYLERAAQTLRERAK